MEFNRAFDPFRALQSVWKAFVQSPIPLLLGGFLILLFSGHGPHFGFIFHDEPPPGWSWRELREFLFPVIGCCGCVGFGFFLFTSWICVGFANSVEEIERTGHGKVDTIFQSKGRFGSMVLARILVWLVCLGIALPLVAAIFVFLALAHGFHRHEGFLLLLIPTVLIWLVPAIYVWLGISLTGQAVALEGLPPVDALKRSWSLVSGNRWMLLLFCIVNWIVYVIGYCFCCIGVFFTGTLSLAAWSDAYLALVRPERTGWWVDQGHAPPAPQAGWGAPPAPPSPPTPSVPV
jgi:hypothetical protein